ncbi:tRNA glutamyl-Q(34) synthetase GluQRS [Acidovorax sp. SUPP3334]|uniref:tRNA glutamyl-Q(34) synthetase GluQRS n=1 Tax=Acidovorax sp. SUPP3334 TaxID=2920881 RepID=UPI0023DE325E|nr:tRNA glutamyl-Q(34) synthetase GluQRS [Acidovorax sp. SUPP3334]GKT20706.1 tRNA glutamyl-Q(34) synthetase GluQRS [Acidovorax sp. SUPP3334]
MTPGLPHRYVGRFAPSPTGPLHAGSLVAALASWLDARTAPGVNGGQWLVRIEDIDTPRCAPGADAVILSQLADCGLLPDGPVQWQSRRGALYQQALERLLVQNQAYPCACSRSDIEQVQARLGHVRQPNVELPYPGTCRAGLQGRTARSWRFRSSEIQKKLPVHGTPCGRGTGASASREGVMWEDRRLGLQSQDVARAVGDFVLRRADGLWAYQLAVVVDDADQAVTHVVRGEDLADNTPRQILLQKALGAPTPSYLHAPLVYAEDGAKLSKQHGAPALDTREPVKVLSAAAKTLGLAPLVRPNDTPIGDALALWAQAWSRIYNRSP